MRSLALLLLSAALFAGEPRYARLGEFVGPVEVQLQAAGAWMPAERNLPLPELAWIRTGPAARVEIEFDDGSVWRLGPDSQGELSDYARLSTGQRVTLLSLDHGLAYFSGKPGANDSLSLAVPGAQAVVASAARLRLEAQSEWSRISVLGGSARFSSPAAEIELRQGLCARVEPGNRERFLLERKIPPDDLDRWNEDRDTLMASTAAQQHVLAHYGLADLDAGGTWVRTEQFGTVWKPKAADGWAPFQKGRWRWYDTLGFTWVSDEPWGWLPYHYGRWAMVKDVGWVWAPPMSQVFKPGEVFWLQGAALAGWGPLAPGEPWTPAATPEYFASAYTTYAALAPDVRTIDPAGFTDRPKEPLRSAAFAVALPSPLFPAGRLDAVRPVLQAGITRLKPILPGVSYGTEPEPLPMQPEPGFEPEPTPDPIPDLPLPSVLMLPAPDAPPSDPAVDAYPARDPFGNPVTPPRRDTRANQPAPAPAKASATAKPPAPPQPPTATPPAKNQQNRELEIYSQILRDANDPRKALLDLDTWSSEFPISPHADERTALYVQTYAAVKPPQPGKAVDLGAQLLVRNLLTVFPDPQRGPTLILSVLYSMSVSSLDLPHATDRQTQSGLAAARQLLAYSPTYFAPSRKPASVTAESWAQTHAAIDTIARRTLAVLGEGNGTGTARRGAKN
jgi:hypothetical protein